MTTPLAWFFKARYWAARYFGAGGSAPSPGPPFITRGEVVFVDLSTSTTTGSVPSASSGYGFTLLFDTGELSSPNSKFTLSLISPRGEESIITDHIRLGNTPIPTGGFLPAGGIMLPYEYVVYQAPPGVFNLQGIWKVAVTRGTYFSRYGIVRIDP